MECRFHRDNCPYHCPYLQWVKKDGIKQSDGTYKCRYHGNNCPYHCKFLEWNRGAGVPKRKVKN